MKFPKRSLSTLLVALASLLIFLLPPSLQNDLNHFFSIAKNMDFTAGTPDVSKEQREKEVLAGTTSLARVSRVVDGDTIVVSINSTDEKVRLLGIDTPETVDPRGPVECFGKEAKEYLSKLLSGKEVRLESDPSQQDRDRYSRLLRYVFLSDGTNVDQKLIAEGYAYEYTYNLPYKYQTVFKLAQNDAQKNRRGLWSDQACSAERSEK